MRYLILATMLVFVIVWGSTADAEMYKYRDAQGNLRYTDNLAEIPENQRPKADIMETIPADEADPRPDENPDQPKAVDRGESGAEGESVVDEDTIAALNAQKKDLDNEFSGLMAEKYALLQERQRLDGLAGRDVEARQAYEGKVADLNGRIADYTSRRDAFQKECDRVQKVLAPAAPAIEEGELAHGGTESTEPFSNSNAL